MVEIIPTRANKNSEATLSERLIKVITQLQLWCTNSKQGVRNNRSSSDDGSALIQKFYPSKLLSQTNSTLEILFENKKQSFYVAFLCLYRSSASFLWAVRGAYSVDFPQLAIKCQEKRNKINQKFVDTRQWTTSNCKFGGLSCYLTVCCFIQNLVHELKNARSCAADVSCLQKINFQTKQAWSSVNCTVHGKRVEPMTYDFTHTSISNYHVSVNVISFEILKKYKVGWEIVRLCCTTAVLRASYQSTFTEKSLLSCLELKVIFLFSSFVPKVWTVVAFTNTQMELETEIFYFQQNGFTSTEGDVKSYLIIFLLMKKTPKSFKILKRNGSLH